MINYLLYIMLCLLHFARMKMDGDYFSWVGVATLLLLPPLFFLGFAVIMLSFVRLKDIAILIAGYFK